MPRPRRHQDPEVFYLLTNRTLAGMFLLLPDEEAKRILLACLAKYVAEHNVDLVCAIFLFNHFHLIARFPDANMQEFMRDFQREVASRINAHRNKRRAPVFPRRYDSRALVDGEALADAISYVINNPVRHGLVGSSSSWPGIVVGLEALSGEREISGNWLNADLWYNLTRRKQEHSRSEALEEIPLAVCLPDSLKGDDTEEKLKLLRGRVETDRQYFRMLRRRDGELPGAANLMNAHWSDTRPPPSSNSRRFGHRRRRCAAATVADFATYEWKLRRIETEYESAALQWRNGEPATFPVGMIPPGHSQCLTEKQSLPPPT